MQRITSRCFALMGVICAIAMTGGYLTLTACRPIPQETSLSFDTIAQNEWAGEKPYYDWPGPAVVVIAQLAEVSSLNGTISEAARAELQTLDYSNYFVLLVLQGRKPSTGYKVTIDRISRLDGHVKISATFVEPAPGKEVGALITSPYHLVQVQKIGTWSKAVSFDLSVGGKSLLSAVHFVP